MRVLALAATMLLSGACTEAPLTGDRTVTTISADATKAAARTFYTTLDNVMRTGNLEALDAVLDPDAVDRDPGMEPGGEAIKEAFGGLRASFPDARFVVEDMIAEGDKVTARVTVHATHEGSFMGIAPTHREVTWTLIDILRFDRGRLVERWGVFDQASLMKQLAPASS